MIQFDESSRPRRPREPSDGPNKPPHPNDPAGPHQEPAVDDTILFVSPPPAPWPRVFPGL